MSARFKKSRLIDQRAFGHRTRFLGLRAFRAYYDLTEYYWEFGRLFSEDSDLADVCGLHVQSFRRIREQLSRLFEVDEAGLWRDPELEAERARAVRTSAAARANGRKGAQARWPAEDPEGMGWCADEASGAPDEMANPMRFAMLSATADEPENGGSAMPSAMPPVAPGGSIDRSSVEDSETIDRSDPRAGAGEAMADGMASAIDFAMAPATMAAMPAATVPHVETPCPEDLAALVREAVGTKGEPTLYQASELQVLRDLAAAGYDLRREILPVLRDVARGLKSPLRTFRAPMIRKKLDEVRAAAAALGSARPPPALAAAALFFVPVGTDAWRQWQAYGRDSGKQPQGYPSTQEERGKHGWRFPSALPPPLDRPAAAAE